MQNFDVFDIMRRGIPYGPELDWTETEKTWRDRGLMFLCYQTSLTLGFQFIRKSKSCLASRSTITPLTFNLSEWIDVDDFPEKKAEFTGGRLAGQDAVVGQSVKSDIKGHHKNSQLAIVDGQGQHNQVTFTPFIQSNGGEYFFTPSLKLLRDLAVAPAV
jgi:deferrochelatase/peroxidase EfeB